MWNKKLKTFRTARQRERRRLGRFFGAVAVFLALFFAFSAVYIGVRSGGFSLRETPSDADTELSTEPMPDVSGVKNLLLLCAAPDKTDIRFLTVMQINFDDNTYTVSSFSPRESVNTGERLGSLLEHYQAGGVRQLTRAIETRSGIQIDRYIASDDNSFKRAINAMGAVTFTFPEQINYRSEDFAIVLIEGEQKMRGDDLLKYLRYCGALGDEGLDMQSQAIGELFCQYINEKNLGKMNNLYNSLINTVSSDISVMDFKKARGMLEYMQRNTFDIQCIQYFRVIAAGK